MYFISFSSFNKKSARSERSRLLFSILVTVLKICLTPLNASLTNLSAAFTQLAIFKSDKISQNGDLSAYNEIVIVLAYGSLRKYTYIGKGTIITDKYVQLYLIDSVPVVANVVISSNYYGINNVIINNQSAVSNPDWRVIVYAR